jgi:ribosomal RNA-processing protein 9
VNGLKFSADGSFLAAAIGQEHRLGRWWRMKEVKNGLCVIDLHQKEDAEIKKVMPSKKRPK